MPIDNDFVGLVLSVDHEHNYHDDSDFYALVYDPENHRVHEVITHTTRHAGWSDAVVDASDEVRAAAADAVYAATLADELERLTKRAEQDIRRGSRVRVVKGRKVPVGTVATVGWYGEGRWGWSVGLKDVLVDGHTPDGLVFTSAKNVVNALVDYEAVGGAARAYARQKARRVWADYKPEPTVTVAAQGGDDDTTTRPR